MHTMRLHNRPFQLIKSGIKTIEMRLYDEKRQLIKVGDIIEFENRITSEIINVEVISLYKFNNFDELYRCFNKINLGYTDDKIANPNDMTKYYPVEEQKKYGVLAIEIKLI